MRRSRQRLFHSPNKNEKGIEKMEELVTNITTLLEEHNIPPLLITFIISLFPILECRGALIAAKLLSIPFWPAFITTFIGNVLPIPFILFFINKIFELLKKVPGIKKIIFWLEEHTLKKKAQIDKYGPWGLLLFVAIPLPGTGGWTGALLASLLKIDKKKSFPIICVGIFIAGLIMSLISYGLLSLVL